MSDCYPTPRRGRKAPRGDQRSRPAQNGKHPGPTTTPPGCFLSRGVRRGTNLRQDALVRNRAHSRGGRLCWRGFAEIQEEPVAWSWPDWLARRTRHLLAGVQGDGKSTSAAAKP